MSLQRKPEQKPKRKARTAFYPRKVKKQTHPWRAKPQRKRKAPKVRQLPKQRHHSRLRRKMQNTPEPAAVIPSKDNGQPAATVSSESKQPAAETTPAPTEQPQTAQQEPQETQQPIAETPPQPTSAPEKTKPKTAYDYEFDIEAIKADCIGIGQSMGLSLDSSLTPDNAAWWNPVTASQSCQGEALKQSLESYITFHTVANLGSSSPAMKTASPRPRICPTASIP